MKVESMASPRCNPVPDSFLDDVLQGLTSKQKHLQSKYFYDEQGDKLFQKIMACPDYYLTRCELDVFQNKTSELAFPIQAPGTPFDLIELGAGDATKTTYLLHHLQEASAEFTYKPIDISGHILSVLEKQLHQSLPDLNVEPSEGDYFDALKTICRQSSRRKVVLFLGSNIGNMQPNESAAFCKQLSSLLAPGDLAIVGFDLKKNPKTILHAYDDKDGLTSQFNLNLLRRINNELNGDIDLDQFEHFQTYDPASGACRSFLMSLSKQTATIAGQPISFEENEAVYMEVSQKYDRQQIDQLATEAGFKAISHCFDSKKWFMDAVWKMQ